MPRGRLSRARTAVAHVSASRTAVHGLILYPVIFVSEVKLCIRRFTENGDRQHLTMFTVRSILPLYLKMRLKTGNFRTHIFSAVREERERQLARR